MKRCPACTTVFAHGGEFCSMDGTRLVPVAWTSLDLADLDEEASLENGDASDRTHHTLVSGSLANGETRLTIPPIPRKQTSDLDAAALTYAMSKGDSGLVGHVIADRYRVEEAIGRGGMGVVYRARHELLDRSVAVKLLRPQFLSDERAVQRFMREAQAMARIEHPNAVTVHDFGIMASGAAYLVMEFVEGDTLRTVLGRTGALPLEDVVATAQQICEAVEAAHRQGVVHRDLKPENILFKRTDEGPIVKVGDFGLAKLVDSFVGSLREAITSSNDLFGTPAYMAPEFYEGEAIDARADVYSIGVILFEMLAGEPPFRGTVQSIMSGHLFKEPPRLSNGLAEVHEAVERVILTALRKAPDERFSSPLELAAALRDAASSALGYDTVAVPGLAAKPITTGALANEFGTTPRSLPEIDDVVADAHATDADVRPVGLATSVDDTMPPTLTQIEAPRTARRPFAAAVAVAAAVALGGIVFAAASGLAPEAPAPALPASVAVESPQALDEPPAAAGEEEAPPAIAAVPPAIAGAVDEVDEPDASSSSGETRAAARPRPQPSRASAEREPSEPRPSPPPTRTTSASSSEDRVSAAPPRAASHEEAQAVAKKASPEKAKIEKKKKRRWFNPFSW